MSTTSSQDRRDDGRDAPGRSSRARGFFDGTSGGELAGAAAAAARRNRIWTIVTIAAVAFVALVFWLGPKIERLFSGDVEPDDSPFAGESDPIDREGLLAVKPGKTPDTISIAALGRYWDVPPESLPADRPDRPQPWEKAADELSAAMREKRPDWAWMARSTATLTAAQRDLRDLVLARIRGNALKVLHEEPRRR